MIAGFNHRALLLMLMLMTVFTMTGCITKNPATGKDNFDMFNEAQEIQMGEEAAAEFLRTYGGPIPDETIQKYVRGVGMQMVQVSERSHLPWEFHAVDSSIVNAFAIPGGKVFITRGLLEKFTTRAQLAGVLAHEVGHVTAQHSRQAISQALAIQLGVTALAVAVGATMEDDTIAQGIAVMGGVGGQLYQLKFSRDNEYEADMLGLRYMVAGGYDPTGLLKVMELFESMGSGAQVEFLSTHPLTEKRIDDLREEIDEKYSHAVNNPEYIVDNVSYERYILRRISNLPPPRHTGQ